MRAARVGACALALATSFAAAGADLAVFDRQGRLSYLLYGGDELSVRSRLSPGPSWDSVRVKKDAGSSTWSADGFRETVTRDADGTHVVVEIADRATWWFQAPRDEFAAGSLAAG